jgi:hypothetical protein
MGGNGLCEITRHQFAVNDLDGVAESDTVVIASATIAHTAVSRTIEAEVYEEEGTSQPGTGPATLIMKVDGVQTPLVANASADGVTVDSSGTVRDASSYLLQGPLNAVSMWCGFPATDGVTTHTVELESIEALAGTTGGPPDSDLASVTLNSEVTGKFGTLTLPLSKCRRKLLSNSIKGKRYVDGRRHKRPRETFIRRRWEVVSQALDPTEYEDFRAFWDDHGGMDTAFDWAPIEDLSFGSGLVSAKFGQPKYKIKRIPGTGEQRRQVSFSIDEVPS